MSKFYFCSFLVFAVVVSAFGMMIILMLVLNPSGYGRYGSWRKPIVGLALAFTCVSGLFASLYPKACSSIIGHGELNRPPEGGSKAAGKSVPTKGHHVDCGRFSRHILRVHGSCVCSACSGLALGALIALTGATGYFFLGMNALQPGVYLVAVGQVGVVLGFVQFISRSYGRLLLNAGFVLGAFLILVEVDSLTESVLADFYTIGAMLVWILARILLSQWDHQRTCSRCPQPCRSTDCEN